VETQWEEGSLTSHTLETDTEFNLGQGETVTSMENTIHIWVSHRGHKFWVFGVELLDWNLNLLFLQGWSILLKDFLVSPYLLILLLNINESVSSRRL
jgi:hypothetical protein